MIISGTGMGIAMPTFTVAVQNTVRRTELGTVTAASHLFRSIGGVFGSALTGNIVLTDLSHRLADLLPPGAPAKIDPGQVLGRLMQMPGDPRLSLLKHAFSLSITHGFFIGAILLTGGLMASLFLEDRELKARWDDQPAME
ncbi:hypothetical protein [Desulfofundulus salinus]|nr:hypothetical protein [Desulfofundulus salinum]